MSSAKQYFCHFYGVLIASAQSWPEETNRMKKVEILLRRAALVEVTMTRPTANAATDIRIDFLPEISTRGFQSFGRCSRPQA